MIDELYEAFYSVITNGTGREAVDFFNQQLGNAKDDIDKLRLLNAALRKARFKDMSFEDKQIFKKFTEIVFNEIKIIKGLQN